MREKEVLPKVIAKYNQFLMDVYNYGGSREVLLSSLVKEHEINKSVVNAMVNLSIIDKENDKHWNWLQDIPDRKLSMTVLNYLLERSKKSRAVVIPGMEETNAILKALSQQFSDYVGKREHSYKTHPIGLKSETLFSEQDSKNRDRFEMAKAISSGMFKDWESINDYQAYGHRIITATDHILELLNKK